MKNSNTEYLNPFLNKVNLTISPINNINIVPKTNNPINVLLSIKQAGPSTLVKEKLIRHNPAATSEWDCSSYSYSTAERKVSPVIMDSTHKLANLFFNARAKTKNASDATKSAMFKHRSILKTFISRPRVRSSINRARITIYKYNRQKVLHMNMLNKSFTLCPNKKQKTLSVHLPLNSYRKKLVTTKKNVTSNFRENSNKINHLNTFTTKTFKRNIFSPLAFEKKAVRTFGSSRILLRKIPSVPIKPSILYSKKRESILYKKRISRVNKRLIQKKIQKGKKRILLNILRNKTSNLVLNSLQYSFKNKPSILVFKKVENYSRKLYVKIKSLRQYIVNYAKMGEKKDNLSFTTPGFVLTTWNKMINTANTPLSSQGKISNTSALTWVKPPFLSGKYSKANLFNNVVIPGLNIGKYVGKLYKRIFPSKFFFSILWVHSMKSNNIYLSRLTNILKKRWKKKMALNVVELKYIYLDSNILAQAVTTKLKDRKKRVLRVLKRVLGLIKKPYYKIHFYNKKKTLEQSNVNFSLMDKNLNISNYSFTNNVISNKYLFKKPNNHIPRTLLYHLKHKTVSGVRLVGSGRLTRRLTASRSISKFKYMGSLQNLESSRQAISTVMLRGHMKSNLQYNNINSYNRNGAFGVKVSVSSY